MQISVRQKNNKIRKCKLYINRSQTSNNQNELIRLETPT